MTPELQTFARTDSGYHQFCEQYNLAVADPGTLNDYKNWVLDAMREEGMIEGAKRQERKIWEAVVAEKDTALADKDALIAELQEKLKAAQNISI